METEQIALFRRLNTVLFDLQGEDMNVAMKDSVNELAVSVSATAAKIKAIQTEAVQQGIGKGTGDNFKIMTRIEYGVAWSQLKSAATEIPRVLTFRDRTSCLCLIRPAPL